MDTAVTRDAPVITTTVTDCHWGHIGHHWRYCCHWETLLSLRDATVTVVTGILHAVTARHYCHWDWGYCCHWPSLGDTTVTGTPLPLGDTATKHCCHLGHCCHSVAVTVVTIELCTLLSLPLCRAWGACALRALYSYIVPTCEQLRSYSAIWKKHQSCSSRTINIKTGALV